MIGNTLKDKVTALTQAHSNLTLRHDFLGEIRYILLGNDYVAVHLSEAGKVLDTGVFYSADRAAENVIYSIEQGFELVDNPVPTVIIDAEGGVVQGVAVTEGFKVNVIVVDRDEDETDEDSDMEAREIEGIYENIDWEVLARGSSFIVVE